MSLDDRVANKRAVDAEQWQQIEDSLVVVAVAVVVVAAAAGAVV